MAFNPLTRIPYGVIMRYHIKNNLDRHARRMASEQQRVISMCNDVAAEAIWEAAEMSVAIQKANGTYMDSLCHATNYYNRYM